ncbi:MAG TPA: hypothetical protein VGH54_09475 [Mycobacterium sp.]|jgi:hypothetical protein|uniref:hypothetical protein n=1 Tax=Mycobacterium sp. TaxID=1785 RepID=UPI002F3E1ED5
MGVPLDNRTIAQRLKALESDMARLRALLATSGGDPSTQLHDPLGNLIFGADIDAGSGILKPRLSATPTSPGAATTVTSASWVEAFTLAGRRQNATWEVRFQATCDAGTTGSVRAVISGTSTELHAPTAIADGDSYAAAWSLALPGGWDDYVLIEIQGERTGGSGNLRVRPYSVAGG